MADEKKSDERQQPQEAAEDQETIDASGLPTSEAQPDKEQETDAAPESPAAETGESEPAPDQPHAAEEPSAAEAKAKKLSAAKQRLRSSPLVRGRRNEKAIKLTLLVPGMGHLSLGEKNKGTIYLALFAATVILLVGWFAVNYIMAGSIESVGLEETEGVGAWIGAHKSMIVWSLAFVIAPLAVVLVALVDIARVVERNER